MITAAIETDEPQPAWQARAAAVAEAFSQGLVLVGNPKMRVHKWGRKRFYVYTWETATAPPVADGWVPTPR